MQTKRLSVIPMRTQTVFPHVKFTFEIGRGMSLAALERAVENDNMVFLTRQRDPDKDNPMGEDLFPVGTVAHIRQTARAEDRIHVTVDGIYRAKAREFHTEDGCLVAVLDELVTEHGDPIVETAHFRTVRDLLREYAATESRSLKALDATIDDVIDPDAYIDLCIHQLPARPEMKQQILEETRLVPRLLLFAKAINTEMEVSKLEKKIAMDVRKNVEKSQREYFLREQIKVIHTELGDDMEEYDSLREKLLAKKLPSAVEEKALRELARMEKMPPSSPEYTVLRNYADWLLDLPWHEETEDASLSDAEKVLEEDHYGLRDIKDRVLEYLAVLKLTGNLKAPILCLVGPPGVGKTSIAKSIARALGRKFVRMSLGGLKDEAEIRGHRRTYVGAMPGRILYEIKNAGSVNPVFLLDEVDKISADLRGDPSSALLEVLDPEQNHTFRDRYLEVEYDLSKVMFIATANTLETIPTPLLDRMEVIELSGYTAQEKEEIALRYLVPKKREENGLSPEQISISKGAVGHMIEGYTREAGVRNLERTIGTVCRKVAVRIAKDGAKHVSVTRGNLESLLGSPRYLTEKGMEASDRVGVATGLAWTAVGGTTLSIEVTAMQGKGEVLLTGKLGDVMKESARAAISYIRANAELFGIDAEDFAKKDVHIHIPEGATPKDGPSAGITLATAILSAFSGRPVRRDIAMTGEITLSGKVLPIGGLKEKALAAARIGIHDIILPKDNRKDIEEIPAEIRRSIRFHLVERADEVFKLALREAVDAV